MNTNESNLHSLFSIKTTMFNVNKKVLLDVIAVDVQGDDPCTSLAKTYTPDYDDKPNSS